VSEIWDLRQHTPASLWQQCADSLTAATASARHPFHLITVATMVAASGPDQRTVVLRSFDPAAGTISFHTDIRSSKVAQLAACPQVSLHWYDPAARVQLRISATAAVHHQDDLAVKAWTRSRATSRACYTAVKGPGAAVDAFPTAPSIPLDDDPSGLVHFAIVICRFSTIEILTLHADGHQRVRVQLQDQFISWQILAP
jgi:pyridoxamine 5'-phosphate oxidase